MNNSFGYSYSESKYRKYWTIWNSGREYERNLHYTNVHTRILAISDLHVPYELPLCTFSDYIGKVDILVLNGDLLDMQAISRFPKAYRESPMEELIKCRQYIIDLIEMIKPKKVVANYGNHELRFQSYLEKNLDSDLLELMPMTALDLIFDDGFRRYDKRSKAKVWYDPITKVFPDIEVKYTGDWKSKIGKTWFAHPVAFSSGNLKTADKTMEHLLKSTTEVFDTCVIGHTHRSGDMPKGHIVIVEQGACCQVEMMNYTDGKLSDPQQKGFLYLCQDKNGNRVQEATRRITL